MDEPSAQSRFDRFFAELRRRRVVHTATAYAASGFVVWQAADIALPALGFPPTAMRFLVLVALAGFPIAVLLSWFFALVPEQRRSGTTSVGRRLRRTVLVAVASVAFVACGGLAWTVLPREQVSLAPGRHVLLAEFENRTGEMVLDGTLTNALRIGLEQSPHVGLLPPSEVGAALEEMRLPRSTPLDAETARQVALRRDVGAVVLPAVERVGERYRLGTRVVDPTTDRTLVARAETAANARDILAALDRLIRQLRSDLGEPLRTMMSRRVPLDRGTTASLEALKAWTDGNREWTAGRHREATLLYEQAVQLDSTFAIAHAALGQAYYWVAGSALRGRAEMEAALRHGERVTDRERLGIRAEAAEWSGDREGAIVALRALLAIYPRDAAAWQNLGYQYLRLNRADDGIASYRRALAIDSTGPSCWLNLATLHALKGDAERALAHYDRAFALAPDQRTIPNVNHEWGFVLFSAGRAAEAERAFQAMIDGTPSQRKQGERSLALLRFAQGRFHEAEAHLRQAIVLSEADASHTTEARNRTYLVQLLHYGGMSAREERAAAASVALTRRLDPYYVSQIGAWCARAGELRSARELLDSARTRADRSTAATAAIEYLAAEIAAAAGDTSSALAHLDAALTLLPESQVARSALARLLSARGDDAGAEAQLRLIIDAPLFPNHEGLGPYIEAHYLLGRILERTGRSAEAVASYRRLLGFWGAGDAGIPLVDDARARVARLAT